MSSRIGVALSLVTIMSFLADPIRVAAQEEKFSSSPAVIAKRGEGENAKPIIVAELVEQLRTADIGKRREIIQQLSDTQQDIVPALLRAMDDPDPLVKSGVAEALGNLTDDAAPAVPRLIEMMNDGRRAIVPMPSSPRYPSQSIPVTPAPIRLPARRPSARSLRVLPARPLLFPPLASPPPRLTTTTEEETDNERRLPPTPPGNPENRLRITAIIALGKIGLPARSLATPPLTEALQDPDPWVKLNATWALSQIGASVPLLSHWLEALQHSDPNLRHSAATVFEDSGSLLPKVLGAEADNNTARSLVTVLNDDDSLVRSAAEKALNLLGTDALPGLIEALKAPEPLVRLQAAELLGNLGESAQSAVPDLLPLLRDTGRYVPPSSNGLFFPPPPRLSIRFPRSSQDISVPANPQELVRVNAAIALGKLGDRSAIPALITAVGDNNPWMQLASGWALLKFGEMQGLPVVGRLVQHPEPLIQREALSQLRGYGDQGFPYLVPYYAARLDSTNDNDRNNAIIRLGKFGSASLDVVPKLRALLVSNKKDSPEYAATILGEIARDTAIAWQNGNLSEDQRQQAIREFTQVLSLMQAPNARFNREPIDRVRTGLATLRGVQF